MDKTNNETAGVDQKNFQLQQVDSNLKNESDVLLDERYEKRTSDIDTDNFPYQEGGWGWVVVIAAAYNLGILFGMVNNYALIYAQLDKVFSNVENHLVYAANIGSASVGVQYLCCIVSSVLVDIYDANKVGFIGGLLSTLGLLGCAFTTNIKMYFLWYGFLYGFGQAMLLAATFSILPHYFKKRLSLANGWMNFLAAVSITVMPLYTAKLLKTYGLKKTFLTFSAINFVSAVAALTYKKQLPTKAKENVMKMIRKSFGLKMFKKRKFVVWIAASVIGMLGYLLPITIIDHHSDFIFHNSEHFSNNTSSGNMPAGHGECFNASAEYLNVAFGAASGISAIVFGMLGDLTKFDRIHYHTGFYIIYGLVQLSIPFATGFCFLLVQFIFLGFMDGILLCFIVTIARDVVESPVLVNQASGYFHTTQAGSVILGPVIAALIFEKYGKYDYAFYFGGLMCLTSAFILIICLCKLKL